MNLLLRSWPALGLLPNICQKTRRVRRLALVVCSSLVLVLTGEVLEAQWVNGMSASYALGQPALDKYHQGKVGRDVFDHPTNVAIDIQNNKIYIADHLNNRVLRFAYPVTTNMPSAEIVFGQVDFDSKRPNMGSTAKANTLSSPYGVAVYNGDLWVSDQSNNRILRYDNAHLITSNAPDANAVLGQSSFVTSLSGSDTSRTSTFYPRGLALDSNGNLFVTLYGRRGINRFDKAKSKANGAPADGLLGRSSFSASLSKAYPPSADRIVDGLGMAVDKEGRLFVADWGYNRVLWFNNAAQKEIGASADGVLGQRDFVSNDTATSQTGLFVPRGIAISPQGRLFVGDGFNNRVLIYNKAGHSGNGAPADYVIGQPDFVTKTYHYGAANMKNPTGLALTPDGHLFVTHYDYSRVMIYIGTDDSGPTSVSELPSDSELYIFPNPANDRVQIYTSEPHQDLRVFNAFGLEIQVPRHDNTLIVSELSAGAYFVRLGDRVVPFCKD